MIARHLLLDATPEQIAAAAGPAPIPTDTFLPYDETQSVASRRADGWSAANQRLFLEGIAEGFGVEQATMRVGLSAASAYAFRRTAKGAAFALGWRAANLVARDMIAETLLVRALEGQVSTTTRANGDIVTRHHHDNGLCMRLLARLDRQVEEAPDPDVKAARLVAQEFDAYLDLVGKDQGPARAGLFLARRCGGLADTDALGTSDAAARDARDDLAPIYALAAADRFVRTGHATADEVDVSDMSPADRAGWTAEQWARAEAAGLVALACPPPPASPAPEPAPAKPAIEPQHSQHSPIDTVADGLGGPVWWDEEAGDWRTHFPPPDGEIPFHEEHEPAHPDYERSLTDAEAALMGEYRDPDLFTDAEVARHAAARDDYFAALAEVAPKGDDPADPPPADLDAATVDAIAQDATGEDASADDASTADPGEATAEEPAGDGPDAPAEPAIRYSPRLRL